MREIPVLINGDQSKQIGWLILLDDVLTDEEIIDTTVSWAYNATQGKRLLNMTLVPTPSVPRTSNEV